MVGQGHRSPIRARWHGPLIFTADYAVSVEPNGPPLNMWTREAVARHLAVDLYHRTNDGRMNTRGVSLLANGDLIDRYDGRWESGFVEAED